MKSKRIKKNSGKPWTISEIFGAILLTYLSVYFIYIGVRQWLEDELLDSKAVISKAVIISEKNYLGNSPVSQGFTYSYRFEVNGKQYKDDSHDSGLNIGDLVLIEYLPYCPSFNRMFKQKEKLKEN